MSIKELKEKEKENRRNYITDSAENIFFQRGYDDVSMNDIAKEVGISRTALYLYFKNKEDIYLAIVVRGMKIINNLYKEGIKNGKNGFEKIGNIGKSYFKFYRDFPDYYKLCIPFDSQRFSEIDSDYMDEYTILSGNALKMMCKSVEEGIEDGSLRPDLNPLVVSIFLATTSRQLLKLDPGFRNALKNQGISYEQYLNDSSELYRYMLINPEK